MSYTTNIDKWYCCLNNAERTAVIACAGNAGPLTYFILKTVIDGIFLLAVEGSRTPRENAYIEAFGLIAGKIPPEDPDGIDVFYLNPAIWDDINAFLDEHGAGCDQPCKIRTFTD